MEEKKITWKQPLMWAIAIPMSKIGFGIIDFCIYPLCIRWIGFWAATILISIVLLVLSRAMLFFYAYIHTDIFALEVTKDIIVHGEKIPWNFASWAFRHSKHNAWIFLVWFYQPYKVVIFNRKIPYDYSVTLEDLRLMHMCWVLRSIYWATLVYFGQNIFTMLWQKITQ